MRNAARLGRRAWAVVALGVVGCQSPPTEPPAGPLGPAFFQEPPAVHRIAFVGNGPGESDEGIYTIRDDAIGLTQVTTSPPFSSNVTAEWSPAAPNRIAFLIDYDDGSDIWAHPAVVKSNGSGWLDLTPAGVDVVSYFVWSPDGARLAFVESGYSTSRLMVVNADGSGLDTIAGHPLTDATAWSPDGQRIVYFAGNDPQTVLINERGIWSVKPDGTGRTKLRTVPGNDTYIGLQFSPDSKKLAMCHKHSNGTTLEVMNADGTGVVSLGLECQEWQGSGRGPHWSPDGTRILTVHDSDLYAVTVVGSSATQLTFDGTPLRPYRQPRWSRQGTKIAYTHEVHNNRTDTEDEALFVMSATGKSKKRLTPVGLMVYSPSWGP